MNQKTIGVAIVILAAFFVVAGAIFVFRSPTAYNLNKNVDAVPEAHRESKEYQIRMRGGAFFPAELNIRAGDTVIFENEDETAHWPASGIHPTHLLCPGFDALKGIKKGEAYSYTFTQPGTCPMHDHLTPRMGGKVTIE